MKLNYLIISVFISAVIYAGVELSTGITGTTLLNGQGCVCHSPDPDPNVQVWVEGPDSLLMGETAEYRIFLTGGPMVKGGFNVASRFSTLIATDPGTQLIAGELTHNQPRTFSGDTVSWNFDYTAADSVMWDTIYSVANSVNGDGIPSTSDHWNFGANFPVRILENIPVEFIIFRAVNQINRVDLYWITATETNNEGFYIERKSIESDDWQQIGFLDGKGTTTRESDYSFSDSNPLSGKTLYRLKQTDFNGSFKYSKVIEVTTIPSDISLEQNYPNPFNPTTTIEYNISNPGKVMLKVYDLTGKEVISLVNKFQNTGKHSVEFNAAGFASGIYIYKLVNNHFTATKKLILLK